MSDLTAAAMERSIEALKAKAEAHKRAADFGRYEHALARIKRERTRQLKYEMGVAKARRGRRG